jgi:hypothetical protein
VARSSKYRGLCETCDYDAICTYRRSSQLAVVQCEEYEATQSLAVKPLAANLMPEPPQLTANDLCANCRSIKTCALPQARDGVLLCEEYELN